MKKKIKIYFTDFWPVFKIEDNFFLDILINNYDVEISDDKPDFIFYSVFGVDYKKFNCKRIFFTGENIRPDYSQCDYSFSFDYSNDSRNFRLPLYALFGDVYQLIQPKPDFDEILKSKTKFCNFVYSNPGCKERNEFFLELSKYKIVDSAGKLFNNTKFQAKNKLELIKDYKFTIAFENESYPGYTTEKIFEPMLVHSMPIYWGNNLIDREFNSKSFINCHDFSSFSEAIDQIIELDTNEDKYLEYYSNPYFQNNSVNEFVDYDNILNQLNFIIESKVTPIALSKPNYYYDSKFMEYRMMYEWSNFKIQRFKNKMNNLSKQKLKMKIDKLIK